MDLDQYLGVFIEESKEHLQRINTSLLSLEENPDDLSIVGEIFRSAHTLKGMSATMGFEDLATLTHEMENVLDLVRNGAVKPDSHLIDVLFRTLDKMEAMLVSIEGGGDGKMDVAQELSLLKAFMVGQTAIQEERRADEGSGNGLSVSFDEYELTIIRQSLEMGFSVFLVRVELEENVLLKAARAFMVHNALESAGELIKSIPPIKDLEEEKFDRSFEMVLVTQEKAEEIEKKVLGISEVRKVTVHSVAEMLKGRLEVSATALREAGQKEPAGEMGGNVPDNSAVHRNEFPEEQRSANGPATRRLAHGKTVRVDLERLEKLMNLFSELVIDRGRLQQIAKDLNHLPLTETVEHMNRIAGEMQDIVLKLRMVPIEQVFNRFPRMVRDLAKELNKKVNFTISGGDTELDRTVIDEIGDPLVHLLRNALDHGLELPEDRLAKGKPETGSLHLRAYYSGNHVLIEVSDDGRGIDRERVLKKAVERGLVSEEACASLTDAQVYEFLFASGFSTAQTVSDISGRGVGLDVVKKKIESLGGSVSVTSQPGAGTTFTIQLPLTLSILSALLVMIGEEKYAIPLSSIVETAVFKPEEILQVHKQEAIQFRGKLVPLVFLDRVFQVPLADDTPKEEITVVIVRKGSKLAALAVDSLLGQQEIVLKPLGNYLTNIFAITGATILGDGRVALILDPDALIQ